MKFGISYLIPESLLQLSQRCENLEFILTKYSEIQHLCAFNRVKELHLIGTAAEAQFKEGDYLDFLVDFTSDDKVKRSMYYMSFKSDLTDILYNNIQLYDIKYITEDSITIKNKKGLLIYKSQ